MLGSQALEVAVGLTLVFLLVSLVLTAVRESIEAFQKTRAADLERALAELLDDRAGTGLRQQFYAHPLIFGLFRGNARLSAFDEFGRRAKGAGGAVAAHGADPETARASTGVLPTYIPRELFATAVEDLLDSGTAQGSFREAYEALLRSADGDPLAARRYLQLWYDSAMDRASGWYKRRSQIIVGVIGCVVAVLLNINAVTVGRHLATNEAAREQAVMLAGQVSPDADGTAEERARDFQNRAAALGLAVGWDEVQVTRMRQHLGGSPLQVAGEVLLLIAGYLIVGLAATLGSPFWFDVLGKIMVIRSTVKPTEKSPDEASKDGGTGGSPKSAGAGRPYGDDAGEGEPAGPAPDRQEGGSQPVIYG